MMKDITLGRYYPGESPLHRADPRLKILLSLLWMVVVFTLQRPAGFAAFALILAAALVLSRIPPIQVFRSLKPVLFILLFAFVLSALTAPGTPLFVLGPVRPTAEGVAAGTKMALRLVYLILTTTLMLTLTTTPILVADAMESLLKPLERLRFPAHDLAMMMSIALRFVPTLVEETDKIMKAQSSRGADYDTGGAIRRARGMVSVLVPLFVSAFRRAEDLAVAMEARCYQGGVGRTRLRVMRFTAQDGVMLAVSLVLAAGAVLADRLIR